LKAAAFYALKTQFEGEKRTGRMMRDAEHIAAPVTLFNIAML